MENEKIIIKLEGRVDSNNAAQTEQDITSRITGDVPVEIDASKLEYISSAGLRVLLHIKKDHPDFSIRGVSSEVYEIFEMTGFTQIISVEKAYKEISIEGCEPIAQGANGILYRIDQDNLVKVYKNANALEEIRNEREVAKLALVLGIPTAISYDVVKVGDSYGSVFELLNAQSLSSIMASSPDKFDWCVDEFVKMLRKIHSTEVPAGKLPDMKETALKWADFLKDYLPEDAFSRLKKLIEDIPHDDHMIHGDYHTNNLEYQDGEVLLIDMDTLAIGHPVFELASMFNAYVGFGELDHSIPKEFLGLDKDVANDFWHKTLAKYLETDNEAKIREVEDKARILGYVRLIRRSIRRKGLESEKGRAEIEHWKSELLDLLDKADSLTFSDDELETDALTENLEYVQDFVGQRLDKIGCDAKTRSQVDIAVEEIFVNIAHYAYKTGIGKAVVRVEITKDPATVTITFMDHGVEYNPLERKDPDITLSAEERDIGGLGIFMTKNLMDDVTYEHNEGKNILKLKKSL
ncbi:MAG: ATP-binding protein [Lachnospiraceae bacterium]|nr:ATP-binding protein [Lachnospiraceae bacterium]